MLLTSGKLWNLLMILGALGGIISISSVKSCNNERTLQNRRQNSWSGGMCLQSEYLGGGGGRIRNSQLFSVTKWVQDSLDYKIPSLKQTNKIRTPHPQKKKNQQTKSHISFRQHLQTSLMSPGIPAQVLIPIRQVCYPV